MIIPRIVKRGTILRVCALLWCQRNSSQLLLSVHSSQGEFLLLYHKSPPSDIFGFPFNTKYSLSLTVTRTQTWKSKFLLSNYFSPGTFFAVAILPWLEAWRQSSGVLNKNSIKNSIRVPYCSRMSRQKLSCGKMKSKLKLWAVIIGKDVEHDDLFGALATLHCDSIFQSIVSIVEVPNWLFFGFVRHSPVLYRELNIVFFELLFEFSLPFPEIF